MRKLDLIVLCGGLGTRIRSKSKGMPKILIPIVKNKPFLLFILKCIKSNNLKKIILSIGYKKEKIIKFIKKNKNLNLDYSSEKELLGTGGAIKNIIKKKNISNPFLVINGDTFFNFNLNKIIKKSFYKKQKKSIILLKQNEVGLRYDRFEIKNKNLKKLTGQNKKKGLINSGLYLFYKNNFKLREKKFSIEQKVLPNLLRSNKLDYIINSSKIFFDIGIPRDLSRFKKFIRGQKLEKSIKN